MSVKIKKILFIQTAFLGDVILSLPAVQTLHKLIPGAFIDYICIPQTSEVLRNNPILRNIIVYDKKSKGKVSKLVELISKVRKENYDIVICPHRSLRSALITHFSKAKARVGFEKNAFSFLLTSKVFYDKTKHEIERNLDLIRNLPGTKFDESKKILKPALYPSHDDILFVEKFLDSKNLTNLTNSNNLIAFAPCSKWFTKRLTINKSVEIIKALIGSGFTVVILGGAEDRAYCKEAEKLISDSRLINLCGNLTPLQSSAVIEKSKCLISVDSAAAHLGASTDTPVVQIYGSTIPAFGFYPLTSRNVVIENNSLDCRPCTDHGRSSCPLKHFNVLKKLIRLKSLRPSNN